MILMQVTFLLPVQRSGMVSRNPSNWRRT